MKYIFTLFIIPLSISLVSCDNKLIPLKGSYPDKPFEISLSTPKEQVWPRIINFLMSKGLSVNTIDEHAGVITTDYTSFINSYTWENNTGGLINPGAFVVCSKVRGFLTIPSSLEAFQVTGQWALLIKEDNDKTILKMSLANATGETDGLKLTVKSTGAFERLMASSLQ